MKIFFSVGEPSGDEHAAELIRELSQRVPDLQCIGYGGEKMQQAGCRLDFKLTDLAVMGITRVLPLLGKFIKLAGRAKKILQEEKPDAVVLVDFPGFNWHIARHAKSCGIPVIYYLPPQIWAWATYRVERMKKYVDHVLCCMPFEPDWYATHGVKADYVGHPAIEALERKALDQPFVDQLASGDVVGILPGSRTQEVEKNWPIQLNAVRRLHREFPHLTFPIACYKQSQLEHCKNSLTEEDHDLPLQFHLGKTSEIIEASDVCLMVSGSVSLELLARGTPAVVLYRCSWLFYWFGLRVIQCHYVSLPNMFAGWEVMPEYPVVGPPRISTERMTDMIRWWLNDRGELQRRSEKMRAIREETKVAGASSKAADVLLERLQWPVARAA